MKPQPRTAVVLLALTLLTACADSPQPFTADGTITLTRDQFGSSIVEGTCWGEGGYDDLTPGAQITVAGPDGKILAVGAIRGGLVDEPLVPRECRLRFEVADIPAGKGIYGLAVGGRDPVQMREEALREPINLTL